MRKHGVTAVVVIGLALAMTGAAWAETCKNEMVLKQATGVTATGQSDRKVAAATLKSPAVDKFEVDVQGGGKFHPYLVMVTSGNKPAPATGPSTTPVTVGGFFTDSLGVGSFELKNSGSACSIHKVFVVDALSTTNPQKRILSGDFDAAPLDPNDPPEVELEIQHGIEVEIQNELNNINHP
jgi:hypothetical protein